MRYAFLIFLSLSATTPHAQPQVNPNNYWQCTTIDADNKQWLAQSNYEQIALNLSYAACKKESPIPLTCKTSTNTCEQFVQGLSTKPLWQCLALDRHATPWRSNYYSQRIDAALAAKAYCRQESVIPGTCYVNLITCINRNENQN